MIRILKRFLFPTIITVLVIAIFILFILEGGMYDDGFKYTTYQLMLGANYKNGAVEFFGTSATGVILIILLVAGALVSWFDFKYDKYVVACLLLLASVFTMLLPITVNKTEVAKYIISAMEARGDGFMTILVGPYITASISLVIAIFALFKNKFNSIFKVAK